MPRSGLRPDTRKGHFSPHAVALCRRPILSPYGMGRQPRARRSCLILSPHAVAASSRLMVCGDGVRRESMGNTLKDKTWSCGWMPHDLRAGSLFAWMRKDTRKGQARPPRYARPTPLRRLFSLSFCPAKCRHQKRCKGVGRAPAKRRLCVTVWRALPPLRRSSVGGLIQRGLSAAGGSPDGIHPERVSQQPDALRLSKLACGHNKLRPFASFACDPARNRPPCIRVHSHASP